MKTLCFTHGLEQKTSFPSAGMLDFKGPFQPKPCPDFMIPLRLAAAQNQVGSYRLASESSCLLHPKVL